MKNQIAGVLIVLALIAGAGMAYLWAPANSPEITTKTYTVTATLNQGSTTNTYTTTTILIQGSNLVKCVVVYYEVDAAEFLSSSSTSYGSATRSYQVSNYTTITVMEQAVGYVTSTSVSLYESGTSTHTGPALASWDETECTWVP
jgi:hypothetical protein